MSTLARDFRAESGDTAKWDRDHMMFWLAHHYRGDDAEQARHDLMLALDSDPQMVEWASWPMMLAKGEWLRRQVTGKASPIRFEEAA